MKKYFEKLRGIKTKQLIYPSIVCIIVAAIAFVFAYSAKFISLNVNKALFVDESSVDSEIVKIDLDDYYSVAKKAGVSAATNASSSNQPQ